MLVEACLCLLGGWCLFMLIGCMLGVHWYLFMRVGVIWGQLVLTGCALVFMVLVGAYLCLFVKYGKICSLKYAP